MDEFVLAHSFGWFAKSLILRDYWFLWLLSVLFELLEYTLAHQLSNFNECWWDHWVYVKHLYRSLELNIAALMS